VQKEIESEIASDGIISHIEQQRDVQIEIGGGEDVKNQLTVHTLLEIIHKPLVLRCGIIGSSKTTDRQGLEMIFAETLMANKSLCIRNPDH
jgi:tRNA 2-selenouridine synthase SelU